MHNYCGYIEATEGLRDGSGEKNDAKHIIWAIQ